MKKKECIEFVTKKVIETINDNFLEIIKNKKYNSSKGIIETIFIIFLMNIIKIK